MNPLGKHFGLLTAGDMMCLDVNTGAIVGGNRVNLSFSSSFFKLDALSYLGQRFEHMNFNN